MAKDPQVLRKIFASEQGENFEKKGYTIGHIGDGDMEDGYGLKMSGTPFGDTRFVAYHLEEKLGKAVSETEKVKRLLHTSPMALATQLIFCEQGLLQFEMQLLDPSIIVPYLERFLGTKEEFVNLVG